MSATAPLVLYGERLWDSPYVFTAFVALREKRLPFEMRVLNLQGGDQRAPDYRQTSLTSRVPAIEHDGFTLSESLAIVEYLEEAFPPPQYPALLPLTIRERARARQVMGWLRSDLGVLRDERSTETMFYPKPVPPLTGSARGAADKLIYVADQLIAEGATSLFDTWCIADADLTFALHRLILNADYVPQKIARYAAVQWSRPSVREFVERDRPK